jgi:hypothetical protein
MLNRDWEEYGILAVGRSFVNSSDVIWLGQVVAQEVGRFNIILRIASFTA